MSGTLIAKVIANSALMLGFVQSCISVAQAFGLSLNDVQSGSIMGAFGGLLMVVGALTSPSVPVGLTSKNGTAVTLTK